MSFGLSFSWRRRALARLDLKSGDTVLDLCAGTGDFAIRAARAAGAAGKVAALDFSRAMLAAGRQKAARAGLGERIHWLCGDAEALGLARESFDAVIVGYGLRNFVFLEQGLCEICRVLRPGGRFTAMEFSIPGNARVRCLYHFYSFRIMPRAGKLITGTAEPFQYLAESIRVFPAPDRVLALLQRSGLTRVACERLSNGLAVLYSGEKA